MFDKKIDKVQSIIIRVNQNYENPNNFMDIEVIFTEPILILNKNNEKINNSLPFVITSEEFMLKYGICASWDDLNPKNRESGYYIMNEILKSRAKKIFNELKLNSKLQKNYYENFSFPTKNPGSFNFVNENTKIESNLDYKLHISINPNYLNEALRLFLKSKFIQLIKVFKITYITFKHHYKTNDE